MNDMELVKWARNCAAVGGDCEGCPFDGPDVLSEFCANDLIAALTERVEKLSERCARYAEEIAVMQEAKRDD